MLAPFRVSVKLGEVQSITNHLRLPGQYEDSETGLYYNYFRDYDPTTGRFVESDPTGLFGGLNPYAYVSGNPTTYADPNGLIILRPIWLRLLRPILAAMLAY